MRDFMFIIIRMFECGWCTHRDHDKVTGEPR